MGPIVGTTKPCNLLWPNLEKLLFAMSTVSPKPFRPVSLILKPRPFKFLPWHRSTYKRTTVRRNFDHLYFFQPIPGQHTSWNFDAVMSLIKISSCCRTLVRRCCYGRNLEVLSTFQYLTELFFIISFSVCSEYCRSRHWHFNARW